MMEFNRLRQYVCEYAYEIFAFYVCFYTFVSHVWIIIFFNKESKKNKFIIIKNQRNLHKHTHTNGNLSCVHTMRICVCVCEWLADYHVCV